MTKSKYIFKPKARQDALDIAVHIARDNLAAAEAFLLAVEYTCERIAKFPAIGSRRIYKSPLLFNVPMLPVNKFSSYLLFYQPFKNGIEIIRILHAGRDLPSLFD